MSRRGLLERGEFRAKPFENTSITYTYFGVDDEACAIPMATRSPQGGEQQRVEIQSLFRGGWRFVTDYTSSPRSLSGWPLRTPSAKPSTPNSQRHLSHQ